MNINMMAIQDNQGESKYIPPIVSPVREFPGDDASAETLAALAAELGMQVVMEPENGLVLPDLSSAEKVEALLAKIVPHLNDAHARIEAAKAAGKHIVYIPGSYDLVHKGHAFYVEQVKDAYAAAAGATRDDMFIVMLADDDMLIADVKASKFVGNGGSEPSPRPVEPAHERVLAMAALDVDLVGLLPSPKANTQYHPEVPVLDLDTMSADLEADFANEQAQRIQLLGLEGEKLEKAQKQAATDLKDLRNALPGYRTMLARQEAGLPLCPEDMDVSDMETADAEAKVAEVAAEFPGYAVKLKIDGDAKTITVNIPVQPWQLYTTAVLNGANIDESGVPMRHTAGHVTRLVSKDDTKYLAQVIYLMHYANVAVDIINDVNIGSTSSLLESVISTHPDRAWDRVREMKAEAMDAQLGAGAREQLIETAKHLQRLMAFADEA